MTARGTKGCKSQLLTRENVFLPPQMIFAFQLESMYFKPKSNHNI